MKKIIAVLIFAACSTPVTAQDVGIIMGTARELTRDNLEEGLIKLKNMGIKYVEGTGSRNLSREQYKALLDKHGFDVISGGVQFEQLENKDSINSVIETLKFYGADYGVCYWLPHEGNNFTFENMKKGVEVFNKAGKQFAEAGLELLYHPHGYEFRPYSGEGTMFDYMMEETDSRYINFQMDVFWIRNAGQNPAALLRKFPGRFPITHLKDRMKGSVDNQNGRQERERNVVLGTGDVNIAEVIKASKEMGVKYHFIEDESSKAALHLPMSLAYIKSLYYDIQAVEGSVAKLHKAIIDADSLGLRNITTEELTYGHSSGTIEDRDTFMHSLVSGASDFSKIDFQEPSITVKGDVAWVRGIMKAELINADKSINPITLKIIYIFVKENGYWRLFGRQAVR